MKIEYKFVTGENVSVEVYGELEEIMLELDKSLKNNDRKETRRHENLNLLDKDERTADITTDVFEDVLKNFDKGKLYDAIANLKPQEQELIHKLYLDRNPMTQAKCSEMLGITENAVRKRLSKIKIKLQQLLRMYIN